MSIATLSYLPSPFFSYCFWPAYPKHLFLFWFICIKWTQFPALNGFVILKANTDHVIPFTKAHEEFLSNYVSLSIEYHLPSPPLSPSALEAINLAFGLNFRAQEEVKKFQAFQLSPLTLKGPTSTDATTHWHVGVCYKFFSSWTKTLDMCQEVSFFDCAVFLTAATSPAWYLNSKGIG